MESSKPNPQGRPLHLAVVAGGTGGHFYPALAVASAFVSAGGRVTFMISGHQTARHLEAARAAGFEAMETPSVRLSGRSPAALAGFLYRLTQYRKQARLQVRGIEPDVFLAMGSYACVPAALAAIAENVPLVLHEANAVTGKANRLLSRWAVCLATSLPPVPGQRVRCRQVHTGLPLRPALLAAAGGETDTSVWLARNGLDPNLPLVLVFGGSQGAHALNVAFPEAIAAVPAALRGFQVLHLCGQGAEEETKSRYRRLNLHVVVKERESEMGKAYAATTLAVSRAGANTVSELALFGVPAILVPLPTATDDHQTANARVLADRGMAIRLVESPALAQELSRALVEWRGGARDWIARVSPQPDLAPSDAAERIVSILRESARPG